MFRWHVLRLVVCGIHRTGVWSYSIRVGRHSVGRLWVRLFDCSCGWSVVNSRAHWSSRLLVRSVDRSVVARFVARIRTVGVVRIVVDVSVALVIDVWVRGLDVWSTCWKHTKTRQFIRYQLPSQRPDTIPAAGIEPASPPSVIT